MKKLTYFALSALATNVLVGCGDNTELEEPIAFPRTCAEAAIGHASWDDGERELFVNGDATKPWKAYCVDLQSESPKEYLSVQGNWSSYTDPNGDSVRTEYDKIRIDPVTLRIDTSDQTFAISTGTSTYVGDEVKSMPLGVALSCGNKRANAQIDVNDTPFVIENQFSVRGDFGAAGSSNPWESKRVIEMWAEGDCGAIAPDLMSTTTVNAAGGYVIGLRYSK